MEELWIPIVAIVAPAVVVALLLWFRYRNRGEIQQTVRLALDKGHDLSPELIDRLGHPKPPKNADLRLAFIWLAIAGGFALMGLAVPDPSGHALQGLLATAAIPFALGVAYLLIWRFAGRD